jgi:hypothetical protein
MSKQTVNIRFQRVPSYTIDESRDNDGQKLGDASGRGDRVEYNAQYIRVDTQPHRRQPKQLKQFLPANQMRK